MADTARWGLPMLEAGQAQKEMTVNEALARLDLLAQAGVVAAGLDTPPATPMAGQAWIVGRAPTGGWAGQAQALAGWTIGGWRFVAPRDGMSVWSAASGCPVTFADGQWRVGRLAGTSVAIGGLQVVGARAAAIPAPAGGGVVDTEVRAAVAAVLDALRHHGLIAS